MKSRNLNPSPDLQTEPPTHDHDNLTDEDLLLEDAPPVFSPAWATRLLLGLFLITLPTAVQAQFNYTTNNGTITITAYTGPGGAADIPARINGLPVTRVGDEAFKDKASVTSVTIPDSVSSIGDGAFSFCSSLTNVAIPSSVTLTGNSTFAHCTSLTSFTIPGSITHIGERAFIGCTGLRSVTIPASVISIGNSAFTFCTSLTNVTIPSSVTHIGDAAFVACTSLKGAHFQGNAPSVGLPMFGGAVATTTVYYLPGTTGWGPSFGGRPTAVWSLPYPVILSSGPGFGAGANGFGFLISWATDASVVVEASPDLATPVWTPVGTNTLSAGTSQFTDPQWTHHPARIYRVVSP